MGAGGLVWVRYGARSMGVHKNNACRDENGRAGPGLGPMVREISPNIMFCKKKQKGRGRLRMGTHGFAWVQWDAFARGDRKTRGNGAKIGCQDMFCSCDTTRAHHEHEHNAIIS